MSDMFDTFDPIAHRLQAQRFLVLDAAMASELEANGLDLDDPLWSARALIDSPEVVQRVHRSYVDAGADIITTASYQASVPGLVARGSNHTDAIEVLRRATEIADRVRVESSAAVLIAASLGPYGAMLADGSEYRGRYGAELGVLADFHRERLHVIEEARNAPDLLAFETIPDLDEVRAIARALDSGGTTAAWVSLSISEPTKLADGHPLASAVEILGDVERVVSVGVNCCDPAWVLEAVGEIARRTELPVIAYPNSGEGWDAAAHRWHGSARDVDDISDLVESWLDAGARIVGGCCRTGPGLTRRLARLRSR